MKERHMGLKRPMRGRRGLPPWAMRQGRGPPPLVGALSPPPPKGLVPYGGGEEESTPP